MEGGNSTSAMSRADDPSGLGDFHKGPTGQELGQPEGRVCVYFSGPGKEGKI